MGPTLSIKSACAVPIRPTSTAQDAAIASTIATCALVPLGARNAVQDSRSSTKASAFQVAPGDIMPMALAVVEIALTTVTCVLGLRDALCALTDMPFTMACASPSVLMELTTAAGFVKIV